MELECTVFQYEFMHTLVRCGDRVVFITCKLCTANDMSPHRSHSIASFHVDYFG